DQLAARVNPILKELMIRRFVNQFSLMEMTKMSRPYLGQGMWLWKIKLENGEIGQKHSTMAQLVQFLLEANEMEYSILETTIASDVALLQIYYPMKGAKANYSALGLGREVLLVLAVSEEAMGEKRL
ncbi:hypothetical protein Tco_1074911, partial [Tanacetum coccineum]